MVRFALVVLGRGTACPNPVQDLSKMLGQAEPSSTAAGQRSRNPVEVADEKSLTISSVRLQDSLPLDHQQVA